jgi:hypothetical protein
MINSAWLDEQMRSVPDSKRRPRGLAAGLSMKFLSMVVPEASGYRASEREMKRRNLERIGFSVIMGKPRQPSRKSRS